ncbi:MAG TPA: DsbC family protein [Usitatibacter sp.]|jgi:thiol:disulfide interchange protein DsbC|nr:DsbC family protein [Usitatibacter sp.]
MKIVSTLAAAALSFLLAAPVLAQDAAERIKAELKKRLPEVTVDSVRKVPYGSLYEVSMGGEIMYTDEKASFVVLGSIVDLKSRENVTEARARQLNKIAFADLPLESAIKIVRGNGSRKVAVFEDPNCGYCKRFERDLAGVNDITVYVFLYPILSESSAAKSKAIWCAPDRGKAWMDTMVRDLPVPAEGSCANPIDKNLALGQSKRINGTPTIIFEDGERVPGAMALADFEKKLAGTKAPKSASSQ